MGTPNNTKYGVIAYLTIIGTAIAIVNNNKKPNPFTSFHIRQMIGLHVFSVLNTWVIRPIAGETTSNISGICLVVLWAVAFVGALNKDKKLVPFFGAYFEKWFKSI
ncbi:conserved membrane hypothetical protein [Tenacibaculum litopenaei]|jgi:uncharacterized membrane protein|uniref:hypothetical protein n=1 Tax=Tenacibaculum litopenaei TaxID=396016 RepID=UPI003894E0FF